MNYLDGFRSAVIERPDAMRISLLCHSSISRHTYPKMDSLSSFDMLGWLYWHLLQRLYRKAEEWTKLATVVYFTNHDKSVMTARMIGALLLRTKWLVVARFWMPPQDTRMLLSFIPYSTAKKTKVM